MADTVWVDYDPTLQSLAASGHLLEHIGATDFHTAVANLQVFYAKYYFEFAIEDTNTAPYVGICTENFDTSGALVTSNADVASLRNNGYICGEEGYDLTWGDPYTTGDIVGVAVDIPNGKIWFSVNGVWGGTGSPAAGTDPAIDYLTSSQGTWKPAGSTLIAGSDIRIQANSTACTYTAPSGFDYLDDQVVPSIANPLVDFGLGTEIDSFFHLTLAPSVDFGLGVSVDGLVGSSCIIRTNFGLDSDILQDQKPLAQAIVEFGLGSTVEIDTRRIDEISVGFGLGAAVEAKSTKQYSLNVGIGLGSDIDLNIPQSYELSADFGLGTKITGNIIEDDILVTASFGLGTEINLNSQALLNMDGIFALGTNVILENKEYSCDLPSHNSGRWS